MSLQLKLNLIITLLLVLMLGMSTFLVLENAREDVRAEVSSTANLALHLLDTEIAHYTTNYGWLSQNMNEENRFFGLNSLSNIRHLKIEFFDTFGRLRDTNKVKIGQRRDGSPPNWFYKLMGVDEIEETSINKSIVINSRVIGQLVITPDPSYEVAEVWHDSIGLLGLVAVFFVMINLIVYWAVRYTFKPVGNIVVGLTKIEGGDYAVRLPEFKPVELQAIGAKFNTMADQLALSMRNNHSLTQQIIRLQEDERKRLARDIHDEIGQYLTAIHVDASAINNTKELSSAKVSAGAIIEVTRQMMDMVHELLERLRPRVLDELGTELALAELIHHWKQRNRNITVRYQPDNHLNITDESVAITAYRVVQECLTNIAKHAQATQVSIDVAQDEHNLMLTIADNGKSFDTNQVSTGFGLAGMKERVEGLFGSMHIASSPQQGTTIRVTLPKQSLAATEINNNKLYQSGN